LSKNGEWEREVKKPRSWIVGTTDYSGFTLAECKEHLEEWRESMGKVRTDLERFHRELRAEAEDAVHRQALEFGANSIDYLERMDADLVRLITETESEVGQAHLELLRQMVESLDYEHSRCVAFKSEYVGSLGLEPRSHWLMDRLYGDYRGVLWYFSDLKNLGYRLRTFEKLPSEKRDLRKSLSDSLELKPNFCGIGLDLKKAGKAIASLFRFRK